MTKAIANTKSPQRWKHLRKFSKCVFWKKVRANSKKQIAGDT